MIIEEHVYARPVKEFCRLALILCSVDDLVQPTAAIMSARGISSVVVCREGVPVGIFTDRDLRKKVVAVGADAGSLRVEAIMSTPLVVVREDDFLFEAVYQMSRHGIHRVGVVDAGGKLCGMLTESDLIRVQTNSPQRLVRQLESAETIGDLKTAHRAIDDLARSLHEVGVPTPDLMRLISHLNDQITVRLIELLGKERFPNLPKGFAFVALGSEGRGEQTLKTDQDNAILFADELTDDELVQLESFSQALILGLIEIGVPECPGGMMAKNPFWRRSLSDWLQEVDHWISLPNSENILHFSMFCDLRTLWGDLALEQAVKSHIASRARQETVFLMQLADRVIKCVPPLGFFGGFKVERGGEHRGQLDLKTAGLFALTEGIRTLGLSAGLVGGGTLEKMAQLREQGILTTRQFEDLQASFNLLCRLRLQGQLQSLAKGEELSNYLAPEELNRVEKGQFHVTLEVVKAFETFLKAHFRLNIVPG